MNTDIQVELAPLKKRQTELSDKLSSLVLQSIVIFGVPAIAGYFTGTFLEGRGVVKLAAYGAPLFLTFVFSWIVFIKKLSVLQKEVRDIEEKIKEIKSVFEVKKEEI